MDTVTIISAIESIASPSFQASWDRSGLQVASTRKTHSHLGVVLDPLPASVRKALDAGCDFILSHHPLALKPALPNILNNYHGTLKELFLADVPLYAAHTSLDTNLSGPAAWFADALAMGDRRALESIADDNPLLGYGLVGSLKACSGTDFLTKIAKLVPVETATITGDIPDTVTRVAYCTGSGASLIPLAERAGADIYISGDIKYHAALDASICLVDVGHHSLEEKMMRHMSDRLARDLTGIPVTFFPSSDPICSFTGKLSKSRD